MKTALLALPLLAFVMPSSAHADHFNMPCLSSSCCQSPARWAPRHDIRHTRLAITSDNGDVVLLITDDVVAAQLSDRVIKKLDRKLHEAEEDADDEALGHVIKTAVLASVRSLLNHSAECPIDDVRDIRYHDGSLVITTENGDHLFQDLDVDHDQVMDTFREADARAFEQEFRKIKKHGW